MGRFRDGLPVTEAAVTLILATLDRIKDILETLERHHNEPAGTDDDLIVRLDAMADASPRLTTFAAGSLVYRELERPSKPGDATLDELEARVSRNARSDSVEAC